MIITRSPLRISLGGGGTDLPSYYEHFGGFLIAAAIDKYVYITLHETFVTELIVKYSSLERVPSVDELKHPIVREAMRMLGIRETNLEITSMADIPAGTGLGSSGSFTTALLRALHSWKRNYVPQRELAEQACHVEIERLGEPVGKQDQYVAAYGGVNCYSFYPGGKVDVEPLKLSEHCLHTLHDNLALFFTGYTRSASNILKEQDTRSRQGDNSMIEQLHFVKQLGVDSRRALESGDLREFAALMHTHWEHKRGRSASMTNPRIDEWYELARREGALGGKLIGAGGGGFLMLYTEDKTRLRQAMLSAGMREVRFNFDFEGTTVVARS
jgi:D-glycero-alpha-D-manno-heptose-7-phosphate kinase